MVNGDTNTKPTSISSIECNILKTSLLSNGKIIKFFNSLNPGDLF